MPCLFAATLIKGWAWETVSMMKYLNNTYLKVKLPKNPEVLKWFPLNYLYWPLVVPIKNKSNHESSLPLEHGLMYKHPLTWSIPGAWLWIIYVLNKFIPQVRSCHRCLPLPLDRCFPSCEWWTHEAPSLVVGQYEVHSRRHKPGRRSHWNQRSGIGSSKFTLQPCQRRAWKISAQ